MRGKHIVKKLGEEIIPTPDSTTITEEKSAFAKKCELIVARYYFYTSQNYAYDTVLTKLAEEFFLSTGRIATILQENTEQIKSLRKQQPKSSWFAARWVHLIW